MSMSLTVPRITYAEFQRQRIKRLAQENVAIKKRNRHIPRLEREVQFLKGKIFELEHRGAVLQGTVNAYQEGFQRASKQPPAAWLEWRDGEWECIHNPNYPLSFSHNSATRIPLHIHPAVTVSEGDA